MLVLRLARMDGILILTKLYFTKVYYLMVLSVCSSMTVPFTIMVPALSVLGTKTLN